MIYWLCEYGWKGWGKGRVRATLAERYKRRAYCVDTASVGGQTG